MFRENDQHNQLELFNSLTSMNPSIKKKLMNTWAPVFYEYIFCQIDEEAFSILYCLDNGRPNFPVNILLSLEYIKHLFDYTDEEIIEQFYFNYLVNYALGIRTLGEMNLAPRTLYDFRERVYQYTLSYPEKGDLIFEQFLNLTKRFIEVAGINTSEQRMDSSFISSNIKKAGRLSLAFDVLEQAVRVMPTGLLSESLKDVLKDGYKTEILFKTKVNETTSKLETMITLCSEALSIVVNHPEIAEKNELKILKRFMSEQAIFDAPEACYKPKNTAEIPANSLQSAYDEDATYRKKGNKSDSGYVMNLAETCSKDNQIQLVTDYKISTNITSDVQMAQERIPEIKKHSNCTALYVDGGYYSEEVIKVAKQQEIDIHYTDMTGRNNDKKLPVHEFKIEEATGLITSCPKGIEPLRASFKEKVYSAHFDLDACTNCEFKEICHIKIQKKSCVVRFSEKTLIASKARLAIRKELKETTSKRAAIEGTNSAIKRGHGADDIKVRYLHKSKIVMGLKITAHNFKKFARHIIKKLTLEQEELAHGIAIPCFR